MSEQRIQVAADSGQLPGLLRFLQAFWRAEHLPPAESLPFELALEEVFVNVATHGTPAQAAPAVELSLAVADGSVSLAIEDDGPAFDPLSLPAPDVGAGLEQRRVGGLGVYLVRQLMDEVRYERRGTRNRLCMSRRLAR